jgi:hypothetical protein
MAKIMEIEISDLALPDPSCKLGYSAPHISRFFVAKLYNNTSHAATIVIEGLMVMCQTLVNSIIRLPSLCLVACHN